MNGIINVLKPPMMTSQGVVSAIKRITGSQHVGHTGTLDPNASGVLPVCIGKSTKLAEYLLADEKEYIGEVLFGKETDSCDTEGNVTEVSEKLPTKEEFLSVLPGFIGNQVQQPPVYSAMKINGKKAYELARNHEEVAIPTRNIIIRSLELLSCDEPYRFRIKVVCSKGTYIRSLARDIARALDSRATLSMLVRSKCGIFDISNAYTLDEIKEAFDNGRFEDILCDPNEAMKNYPCCIFPKSCEKKLLCGNSFPASKADSLNVSGECDLLRIVVGNELIAIGKAQLKDAELIIQPVKVIAE